MSGALKLWVHVYKADVSLKTVTQIQASVCVDGGKWSFTRKHSSTNQVWQDDLMLTVQNLFGFLWVDLHSTSLFNRQLLGRLSIPLYSIRHSNKPAAGEWMPLVMPVASGAEHTNHRLRLDLHYELPPGLDSSEEEKLEAKLGHLSSVLEEELDILEQQQDSISHGELDIPCRTVASSGAHAGSYEESGEDSRSSTASPMTPSPQLPGNQRGGEESVDYAERKPPVVRFQGPSLNRGSKRITARQRWQRAIEHPRFREMVARRTLLRAKAQVNGAPWGIGTSALADLVNQVAGLNKIHVNVTDSVGAFSSKSSNFLTRRKTIQKKRETRQRLELAEDFKTEVYKRVLQAIIYPTSAQDRHDFREKSYRKPTYCNECEGFIWGLAKQGVQCKRCGKNAHKRCATLASQDCFHIRDSESSFADMYSSAVEKKMSSVLTSNSERFQLLRAAFQINEGVHGGCIDQVTRKILELARNFTAKITVKVIAAQGLALKGVTNRSIYVSVDVGGEKKRTDPYRGTGHPQWNTEFDFLCYNYLEPIRVRVWNEEHGAVSKAKKRMTTDLDLFLGQKIIEVQRIGAPQDIWYKLERRTEEHLVSGAINLNLAVKVEGESQVAPFHKMYTLLHEQLFHHCHVMKREPLVVISEIKDGQDCPCMLSTMPQYIIDEFAMRFAVEPVYRMMVHLECLVENSNLSKAMPIMSNVLGLIKARMFQNSAEDNAIRAVGLQRLMDEQFDACNFGRDKFSLLLERMMAQLRLELQQYREMFPVNDSDRLNELTETCNLIRTIYKFLEGAMNQNMRQILGSISEAILSSMRECQTATFQAIKMDLTPPNYQGHLAFNPDQEPYQVCYEMMRTFSSVEYEDRTIYYPLIKEHCNMDLGDISLVEMWKRFSIMMSDLFEDEANLRVFPPIQAIHLLCTIKKFFEDKVFKAMRKTNTEPTIEYPYWFESAVKYWIQDFSKNAFKFVNNCWDNDKKNGFKADPDQYFSPSAYDMFMFFSKGEEVIKPLDGGMSDLQQSYAEEYAKVVKAVVLHVLDMISMEVTSFSVSNLQEACMLLNNLQFTRIGLQSLYEHMGKEATGKGCDKELTELQTILNKQLSTLSPMVVGFLKDEIWGSLRKMQAELIKLKPEGSAARQDAKDFAEPLLETLFQRLQMIAEVSEKTVILPKLVKEVWYVIMEGLQFMLLPPMPGLGNDDVSSQLKFSRCNYNQRQCAILEIALDVIKEFFDDGFVKKSILEKGVFVLKAAVRLYRQTTVGLVADFMKNYASAYATSAVGDESCGQVALDVSATSHPGSGEREGHIRVIAAQNLKSFSNVDPGSLKPYIEINVLQPIAESMNRPLVTPTKATDNPSFGHSFDFYLPPAEFCEVQVTVYHKRPLHKDKLLGVAVVPFAALMSTAHTYYISLGRNLPFTDRTRALLTVLMQRTHDEMANRFVSLKMQKRSEIERATTLGNSL